MRKIEVVPYNKDWPFLFQKETSLIKSIFGHEIVGIYHIGSTSLAKNFTYDPEAYSKGKD